MKGTQCHELLEKLASFSAGHLPHEEARGVERLIREDPEALRITGQFLRTLALRREAEEKDEDGV